MMAGRDATGDRDGQTAWPKVKNEGHMCLWMMLNTMIADTLESREKAVA